IKYARVGRLSRNGPEKPGLTYFPGRAQLMRERLNAIRLCINYRAELKMKSRTFRHFLASWATLACSCLDPSYGTTPEKVYQILTDQVVLIETFDELGRPWKQGSGVVLGKSLC